MISLYNQTRLQEVSSEQLAEILKARVSLPDDVDRPIRARISHKPGIYPEEYECILDDVIYDEKRRKFLAVVYRKIGVSSFQEDYDLCITPVSDFGYLSLDPDEDGSFTTLVDRYFELSCAAKDFLSLAERLTMTNPSNRKSKI